MYAELGIGGIVLLAGWAEDEGIAALGAEFSARGRGLAALIAGHMVAHCVARGESGAAARAEGDVLAYGDGTIGASLGRS